VISTSSTSTTTTTEAPKPLLTPTESAIIARITDEVLAEAVSDIISDGEITVEVLDNLLNNENFDSLDETTLEAISVALSAAPDEVKEEFESQINVFEGGFDSYVPTGSRVDVGTRRVVIAVSATVSAAAAAPAGGGRRRR
jgi:hypothetical protein